jgi:hypothetical protein
MSVQQSSAVLSAADHARQSAAFRTSRTGIPGVTFDIRVAAFKASCVGSDGPVKLGMFDTMDEAVTAVSSAYAMGAL